jgi:hypothetical protein
MAAFQMFQTELTFGEMSEKADQFGSALLAMGLQEPGSVRIYLMLILSGLENSRRVSEYE